MNKRNTFFGFGSLATLFVLSAFFYQPLSTKANQQVSFFDHFEGASLGSNWSSINSGAGNLQVSDSYAECSSPQAADACAFYYSIKIDKSISGVFALAQSDQSGTFPQTWFSFINSVGEPQVMNQAAYNSALRMRVAVEQQGSTKGITFQYYNGSHQSTHWNGSTNTWTSSSGLANSPITADDYYVNAIEIDAENNRWRMLSWAKKSPGSGYTFEQGLRLFALTDWVSWQDMENTDDLWLVIGDPVTDSGSGTLRTEWVRGDFGNRKDVWVNTRTSGEQWKIRHGWGYESASGMFDFIVPESRTTLALDTSTPGNWDSQHVKDQFVFYDPDDQTYYLLYTGNNNGKWQIGLASKSTPDGTFNRVGSTPIITRSAGTNEDSVFAPSLVKDMDEPDPNKRFKMLYTGIDTASSANWRIFLATAPAITGPWTKQGMVLDRNLIGTYDQNGYSRPKAVYSDGQWHVFVSAKDQTVPSKPWRVTYATGPELNQLTSSGVILVDIGAGPVQNLSANLNGRTVKVPSTTGYVKDAYVVVDQDSSTDNFGSSRIRKVVDSTTLELYHSLSGFNSAIPAKIAQIDGFNTMEIADVRNDNGMWQIYITPFNPVGLYAPSYGSYNEIAAVLTSPNIGGPYTWSWLASPVFTPTNFGSQRSNENITFVHYPTFRLPQGPDTTAPVISNMSAGNISTTTANITWFTNESSSSKVEYGLDQNFGGEVSDSQFVFSHNLPVQGLSPDTVYYYQVVSTDQAGNTATSSVNSFTTSADVYVNQALRFDGVNDVLVGPSIALPTQISFSAWVKPSSLGEGTSGHIFALRDDSDNNPNAQLRFLTGNRLRYLTVFDNNGSASANYWDTPNNSIVLNAWNHVVLVYDGSSATNTPQIYINGVMQSMTQSGIGTGVLRTGAAPIRLGNNPAGAATVDGVLDEAKLYNRLLTAQEASELYVAGLGATSGGAGLLGEWHFDEGAGVTTQDSSGNGNNLDLVNGPAWLQN